MDKVKNKSFLVSLPADVVQSLDDMASQVSTSRNGLIKLSVMSFLADYTLHVIEKSLKPESRPFNINDFSD